MVAVPATAGVHWNTCSGELSVTPQGPASVLVADEAGVKLGAAVGVAVGVAVTLGVAVLVGVAVTLDVAVTEGVAVTVGVTVFGVAAAGAATFSAKAPLLPSKPSTTMK